LSKFLPFHGRRAAALILTEQSLDQKRRNLYGVITVCGKSALWLAFPSPAGQLSEKALSGVCQYDIAEKTAF
jgi:hypothetical protein